MRRMGRAPKPRPGATERHIVAMLGEAIAAAGHGEQARVARAAGMSAAQLSRCLSGQRLLTFTELRSVSLALNLSLVGLVSEAEGRARTESYRGR